MNLFSNQIPVDISTPAKVKSGKALCLPAFVFMENEIWKDIIGFEGLYQISNKGNVKALVTKTKNCNKKAERILKFAKTPNGYLNISLCNNGYLKQSFPHRLVAESFIPNPENKPQINHINGIKTDNRVENLEWCTAYENQFHAYATGLKSKKGEKHHHSKLTENDILAIRAKYKWYVYTAKMLAKEYNVRSATIQAIISRTNWTHI